jgi:hypothetical protein
MLFLQSELFSSRSVTLVTIIHDTGFDLSPLKDFTIVLRVFETDSLFLYFFSFIIAINRIPKYMELELLPMCLIQDVAYEAIEHLLILRFLGETRTQLELWPIG